MSMIRIQEVLDKVAANNKNADLDVIRKAYVYAASAHEGQVRLSGEPYLSHLLAVADSLAETGFDEATICAGLLHDTVEDTKATLEEIEEKFGEEVADLVDGVTKLNLIPFDTKEEAQAENIRKMILAMSHDIRVLLIKLADRLHNMRTLRFQKAHKQKRISQETMDIYVPLANRLGLYRLRQELEDLSFRYQKPDAYAQIAQWLEDNQVAERRITSRMETQLEALLKENGIRGEVSGRIKSIYSIHKKMTQQHLSLDEMHDIMAFRVLVHDVKDCYALLGLVHSQWVPVQGRFKDYISMPKANGYQSLHTTVIGPEGERVEIQTRTVDMHRTAEHGVASHWMYKESGRINAKDMEQFTWLREIFERQRDETDSREFMHSLRMELFKDEVYVYTPRGEVKELPEGATPLDFAFLIHTEVGMRCAGAKVNGKLVPLGTPLKNGDTVEIITDSSRNPSRDWLKLVKTAKARNRVQHYIRTEERARAVAIGREMLEKEGRKLGLNVVRAAKEGQLALIVQDMNMDSLEELYASVGYAHNTPRKVLNRLYALLHPQEAAPVPQPPEHVKEKGKTQRKGEGVGISGVDGVLVRFAKCCNPVPGDPVIGYISRGLGITVHTLDCVNVSNMEPERMISVNWDGEVDKPFPARVHMLGRNKSGVLADIAQVFAKRSINIDAFSVRSRVDGRSQMDCTIEVRNAVELYQVIDELRRLPDLLEVARSGADD
jgi:GTP pyrophosphokinase